MSTISVVAEYETITFHAKYLFLFLSGTMVVCWTAFGLLNFAPYCNSQHAATSDIQPGVNVNLGMQNKDSNATKQQEAPETHTCTSRVNIKGKHHIPFFVAAIAIISSLSNRVLPSIQSYSCIPYGMFEYHLTVILTNIANPLGRPLTHFAITRSVKLTSLLTAIGCALFVYMHSGHSSPHPSLAEHPSGSVLILC